MIDRRNIKCPFICDYQKMVELCVVMVATLFTHTVANPDCATDNAHTLDRFVALAATVGDVSMLKVLQDVNEMQKSEHNIGQDVLDYARFISRGIKGGLSVCTGREGGES